MSRSYALPANDLEALPQDDLPAGRRPTINDVARLAGVSKKTVSRIINDEPKVRPETRAKVEAIIAATGYVPDLQARALAIGKPCLVGMIYEPWMAPSMMLIPAGMLSALAGSGIEMVIHPSSMASPNFLNDLRGFIRRQRLLGVVLTPPISDDQKVLDLLDEMDCAYVRIAAGGGTCRKVIDTQDTLGGRLAAEHLLGLGHRRFAFIAGLDTGSGRARLEGFRAALAEAGVTLAPGQVIDAGFGYEKGLVAGVSLLALNPRPTAVFADTDELAAGVLRAVTDAGVKAPDAMSVVGYGDFRVAPVVSPPLTTIRSTTWSVGALAVQRLLKGSDGGGEAPRPDLVVRGSTAQAPH